MVKPTRKAVYMALGSLVVFGVGANSQAGWLYVIGAGFVGVIVAGLVLPRMALRNLVIDRTTPRSATQGEPFNVELVLHNSSRGYKGPLSGSDEFMGATTFVTGRIAPRGSATIAYEVQQARRGVFHEGNVLLRSAAPFGLGVSTRAFSVTSRMIVHPRWVTLSGFPLLESASTPNEVLHERPRRGAGLDFYGLREYRSGDSLRHIHWRSTARGGKALVREYEEQPASRLTVLIDSGEDIGEAPNSTFEDSISCAASLVMYALDVGHPVQLFCDGREGTQHLLEPGKIEALDWMAGLVSTGRRGLKRVAEDATALIYRRSTNVLIFPATRRNSIEAPAAASMLQTLSARVIAVMISTGSYPGNPNTVLSEDGEMSLASELAAGRTIVFRLDANMEMTDWLHESSLV